MPGSPLSAQHGEDIVPIINRVRAQNDPLFSVVAQVRSAGTRGTGGKMLWAGGGEGPWIMETRENRDMACG